MKNTRLTRLLCITSFLLSLSSLSFDANAQNNGLEIGGTLDGWELYTGKYVPEQDSEDEDSYTYVYEWDPVTEAEARQSARILLSSNLGATDPIIACSGFYVNPDNETVIQIGKNTGKAEAVNDRNALYAYAERIKYKFTVTEESTLFTYKYACVLHVPTGDNHTSYQMPAFNVSVLLESPSGQKYTLPCEEFSGNASFNNSLIRNPSDCRESKVETGQYAKDYVYQPWTTVSYDLTSYIGYTVSIEIISHDCLVTNKYDTGKLGGGSHKAYGYFWGKTEPLKLTPKNCGNDDAVLTAPTGFVNYKWYRCDEPGTPFSSTTNTVTIPVDEIVDGAHYCCEMIGSNEACTRIQTDTVLSTIDLVADFAYENDCDMKVNFTSKCIVARDEIKKYKWDFGDGFSSAEENPTHEYQKDGAYTVSLTIVSGNGCSTSISKPVTVRPLPQLSIDGEQNVCQGDMIALSCLSSQVGNAFFWLNQAGDTISHDISMTERAKVSQTYSVYIIDQYSCAYSKNVDVAVSISPSVFIKGDSSVCLNTPAKLWVWGDADKYVWSTAYEGDTLHFTPQQSAEYCVTGTYTKTGCKTQKCVKLKVNELPEVSVEGPEAICAGQMAVLKAKGAEEYLWQDIYYGDSLTVGPTVTTTYSLLGTDTNGCANMVQYRLVVNTTPNLVLHGNRDVCDGEQLSLWVEGAQSYVWDDGTERSVVSRVPTLSTTSYWVEGVTNNCKARLNIPIVVNPVPSVIIQGKEEICAGETVSLFAQGGSRYEWNTGEVINSIDKTLTSSQTFYVKGYSDKNCVSSASYRVNVRPLPEFAIEAPSMVCEGSSVLLSASSEDGKCTFQWDSGFLGSTYETFVEDTTQVVVMATDTTFGCSSKKKHTIYTLPYPTVKVDGKTTICSGTVLNISASGASSYKWSDGTTSSTLVSQPGGSVNLWVEGTTNGCTTKLEVPVTVLAAPYVWVDGSTSICFGDTLYLTARGADSYMWNATVKGEDFRSKPSVSSTVSVIGTNSDGCTTKLIVPFTVRSKPSVGIVGHETVCVGGNVTLTATGSNLAQFVWNTGESDQTVTVAVPSDQTFEVTAWDAYGCSNSATHDVSTIEPPVISFTGDTSVCEGGSISLYATGATNFTWKQDQAIIGQGDRLSFVPQRSSVVTLSGSSSNCASNLDIYLKVNPIPNVAIVSPSGVCRNQDISLTAVGADHYVWSTGDTTATITQPLQVTTSFIVTGTMNNGCVGKNSKRIEVYPDLNVSLEEVSKSGCPGSPSTIVLSAEGALVYTYSSDPYNATITGSTSYDLESLVSEPTDVYVIGTDINGCLGYDTIHVEPKSNDGMGIQVLPAIVEQSDPTVHFNGVKPQNAEWRWRPGDGSDALEGMYVSHTYDADAVSTEDSFKVVVRAKDEEGCVYETNSYVYVWRDFWAPTAFSPNGDGLNDLFRFQGGEFIEHFQFIIYDRTGKIVFKGESLKDEWEGTYENGEPCPQGVYGWSATYSSNYKGIDKEGDKKGLVTIIR